ncbi:MAG: hypothetical protein ACREVL_11790 [Solimonas sp.]
MLTIAWFEFRNRLRLVSTWLYFSLYALLSGFAMVAAGGVLESASVSFGGDKILIDSPYALSQAIAVLGFIGITVIAAIAGRAVQQDFEHGIHHFFFTAPIAKRDYFFGRLLGAWLTLLLVFCGIGLGLAIGSHWPGVDELRVSVSPSWQSYLRPYLYSLWPNLLWLGACFFTLAALTRQMAPVYVAGVVALVGYMFALNLLADMDNKTLAAIIDPTGATAIDVLTRYWTVAQKNGQQIPFSGILAWNRLLWLGVGAVAVALGYRLFRMEAVAGSSRRGAAQAGEPAATTAAASPIVVPAAVADRSGGAFARMLPGLVRLYLGEIVRSPRFLTIVLAGAMLVIGNAWTLGSFYGTNTWPLTYKMLDVSAGLFGMFVLIVTAIYAGELVWRERDTRVDEISDSAPAPTWLPFVAKLCTLLALQALLLLVVMLCSMLVQLAKGYTHLEPGLYVAELFGIQWPGLVLIAVMALLIHALVNNKYVGHFFVVLWFFAQGRLPALGLEDRLYLYGSRPDLVYSDLNGYGHFLGAVLWFRLYWGAFAVALLVLAYAFWVRGRDGGLAARADAARRRLGRGAWTLAGIAGAVFAGSGAWIFYNTHVLNPFVTANNMQRMQADYEKRYKPLAGAPQPRITAVDLHVDIDPAALRATIGGTLTLVNKTAVPIADLYLLYPRKAQAHRLEFGTPSEEVDAAPAMYWHHHRLATPLAPGASLPFNFEFEYAARGFRNDGADPVVLGNGSFLNAGLSADSTLIPSFGYSESAELESDRERRKYGLAPKPRMHDLDDAAQHRQNALSRDADWIDYRATVCTAADQLPVTSGYVQKDWTENGRHCIAYRMDTPMADIYSFVSARYAVRHDVWHGPNGDVAIEIDYHPGHEYNVERMVESVQDSLGYFSAHFSPYQHHIARILEFPRYARFGAFAESFPNTVPFNEAIGFTARIDAHDADDIDYPYFVTAHEIAHQWWAHQENPANVQGAEFITESLAEYSALMVLRQKYGDAHMRRFLKYELDRYLMGRGLEQKEEQPLLRADGAAYVHYQKGALTLYALQDAIGEAAMNDALSAFVRRWRFQGPPYATSRDLLAELRRVTPAQYQSLITDFFETITLYDSRATAAEARALGDGRYEITVHVTGRKIRADGAGNETAMEMDAPVDIGALDADGKAAYLEKQRLKPGDNVFRFVVDHLPAKAGIDPLDKLIDRDAGDNVVPVTPAASG